jgi:transcriptional regulator with XRE-family HTH domain
VAGHTKNYLGDRESELIFGRKLLGVYMRLAREKAGVSQRYIEVVTGISNSEISKVENGSQECRLESFVRMCAALGVSCGEVLDRVLVANPLPYEQKIKRSPHFQKLAKDHPETTPILTLNLAVFSCFAAHLIRCSRPIELAKSTDYPDESVGLLFVKYAEFIETISKPADRLKLLEAWRDLPVEMLAQCGFLETGLVSKVLMALLAGNVGAKSELRDMVLDAGKIRRDVPVWMPFIPKPLFKNDSETAAAAKDKAGDKKDLTDSSTNANLVSVKLQLPSLLVLLNRATKESGKMSALAEYLEVQTKRKVPLASVSRWLSGKREPGGEITLLMLRWIEQQERQK